MKTYKKPKPRSPFNQLRKYLSPKEMRKVIRNTKNDVPRTVFSPEANLLPPKRILRKAFSWSDAPEGFAYWDNIDDRLMSIS
jgi:hypothetical protein